jgi:GT2 family glycosyltransferase
MTDTTMNKEVLVAILSYNGMPYLKDCLDSVRRQSYKSYDLIVIDNGSQDGSPQFVRENYSQVKVIENGENLGFAKGFNVGVLSVLAKRNARYKYVGFLMQDVRVDRKWLGELVEVMDQHKEVALSQSLILNWDGSRIDDDGGLLDPLGYTRPRNIGKAVDEVDLRKPYRVFYATGGAMLLRVTPSIVSRKRVFDPIFGTCCEDIDLSWGVRLHGNEVLCVPTSKVFHKEPFARRRIGAASASMRMFLSERNSLIYLTKNLSTRNLLKYVPISIVLRLILAASLLLYSPTAGKARIKGLLSFLTKDFKAVWRDRLETQEGRAVPDRDILKYSKGNTLRVALGLIKGYI